MLFSSLYNTYTMSEHPDDWLWLQEEVKILGKNKGVVEATIDEETFLQD